MKQIIVIGGGAAGLMAAGAAAEAGARVTLFEKNPRPGRKLMITGKGRCNVTNDCDIPTVLANVPTNPRFLYSALHGCPPAEVMAFFEREGVPLKTERGGRVFPVSDKAVDIVDALHHWVRRAGVRLTAGTAAEGLALENGGVRGVYAGGRLHPAEAVILATGGASYPLTGSTGDGYRFAAEAGHTVIPPRPSLVPLVEDGDTCAVMMGLSLKNVRLTVFENDRKLFSDFGELLFTHFGLSGPMALSASAHMRHYGRRAYRAEIDLKPALDEAALDARLLSDFAAHQNQDFINALGGLLPRKMIPVLVGCSGIDPRRKVHSVTKAERGALLRLLKAFPVRIAGPRPIEEAIVTTGGVSVKEISPKTMESKICPGLYLAGELIDVDGYTGGFNLQIAWATGRLAGQSAARETEDTP